MIKRWMMVSLSVFVSTFLCEAVFATGDPMPTTGFLQWSLPTAPTSSEKSKKTLKSSATAVYPTYPIYIYTNGQQVGYIAAGNLQYFVGPYPVATPTNYNIYYKNNNNWYGCSLTLSGTTVTSVPFEPKGNACLGAVINPPAQYVMYGQ
jgi:hypothetical protein